MFLNNVLLFCVFLFVGLGFKVLIVWIVFNFFMKMIV